jgi:hypothetical protein
MLMDRNIFRSFKRYQAGLEPGGSRKSPQMERLILSFMNMRTPIGKRALSSVPQWNRGLTGWEKTWTAPPSKKEESYNVCTIRILIEIDSVLTSVARHPETKIA